MSSGTLTFSPGSHPVQQFDIRIDDYAVIEWPDYQMIRLDLTGRWCTFQSDTALYRRTVDGEVVIQKGQAYESVSQGEHTRILEHIKDKLKHFHNKNTCNNSDLSVEKCKELNKVVGKALSWHLEDYRQDTQTFRNIYPETIPILPPDRYRDIVVQPATGCPYGKCSFCMFYKDQRFHILDLEEFQKQLTRIRSFYAKSIRSREGIFLGSASAISIPQGRLLPFLKMISYEFTFTKRGISSFMDPHHMPKRSVVEYKELKEAGLRQVVIGLETGSPTLREQLGKSDQLSVLEDTIGILKQAGIEIGITILIGAGGPQWAVEHLHQTAEFIRRLSLEASDMVYLSPLVEDNRQVVPEKELSRFKKHLKPLTRARLVPYRLQKFRYFS